MAPRTVAPTYDVVVVGAGNAALCAALAARQAGASVAVLERAPAAERGGNSRFTMAAMRFAYSGLEDLRELAPELGPEELETTDFGRYPQEQFREDLLRVTEGRCEPRLLEVLVQQSRPTLRWMRRHGVRFRPLYGEQAYEVDGRYRFWGGLTLQAAGGGPGLVQALLDAAAAAGVDLLYETRARRLLRQGSRICGVAVSRQGRDEELRARAVVLACGGFEANAEWRARYLGPGWDLAKVRGSRFNTGDGLAMALDAGARPRGHWSGCHAVAWDRNAPEFGDLRVRHKYQKHSYPLGIVVNARGERFLDEGADFRNYTYAKYGGVILQQPGQFAWQVFDARVSGLLREEYRVGGATHVTAGSLDELARRLDGVDPARFLATVRSYNRAVKTDVPFEPNRKDGRSTHGLAVPKSNWANRIDRPPFEAWGVTCGITFTFGGLAIDAEGRVLDGEDRAIGGLFAAGELVGGLFYFNYPGGAGLTAGAVFGRIAGEAAARHAAAAS